MDTNVFADAPEPARFGRCLVVPMHILGLRATVTIQAGACRAVADATMNYVVGPTHGQPLFDLRQEVTNCWLDGVRADPAVVAFRDVGEPGQASLLRVIRRQQIAGSTHALRVVYRLGLPQSDLGGAYPPALCWHKGPRVTWSFGLADLYAGRHLEAWFPSNLPFDHFPFALDLRIAGTSVIHTVITNGRVTTTGTNRWSIQFPEWFTTMSPLIELRPADMVEVASASVLLPVSRRPITVTACKPAGASENLTTGVRRIATLLSEQERRFGGFSGDSYTCFFHGAAGGMEYAYATTTSESALRHEVIHSWFARGVTPASQADGWWDEGFARYLEVNDRPEPFDYERPAVELCSRRPFQRTTSPHSYAEGSRLFRGIAAVTGPDRLIAAMKELYGAYCRRSVSTATLEAHLIRATGAVSLVDAFHRFVYGFEDPARRPHLVVEIIAGVLRPEQHASIDVRVRNDGPGPCRHFVVVIAARNSRRFDPPLAVVAQFDLAPGRTRTIRMRLPRDPGVLRSRLVASVHARGPVSSAQRGAVTA